MTKIYIAGHKGMVGMALVRKLKKKNIILVTRSKSQLDLTDQKSVMNFFFKEKPDQVYVAAAKVGGIYANNNFAADFIYINIMIASNIINAAFLNGVRKLLFLGSSCIYPKTSDQPIKEKSLLQGLLEPTNEAYAISKIAGIKLCESYNKQYGKSHDIDYRSIIPTNLYGTGDNYHLLDSHVIPALIRKFHDAKLKNSNSVVVWGTGKARREFLHVDDLASASIKIMNLSKKIYKQNTKPNCSHINVGFGHDITIRELAKMIKKIVGFRGNIIFDKSQPDGMLQKLLDCKLIKKFGWQPKINLENGLKLTYNDFKKNYKKYVLNE